MKKGPYTFTFFLEARPVLSKRKAAAEKVNTSQYLLVAMLPTKRCSHRQSSVNNASFPHSPKFTTPEPLHIQRTFVIHSSLY
jgi:hypothetical protein